MFPCKSYKVFKNIYFTEHLWVTAFVFCIFFCNFGKKAFWIILQYFRKSSCKFSYSIVWLRQSLSAYCYRKMPKFSGSPRNRTVPSVNNHPAIVGYSKNSVKTVHVSRLFVFMWLCDHISKLKKHCIRILFFSIFNDHTNSLLYSWCFLFLFHWNDVCKFLKYLEYLVILSFRTFRNYKKVLKTLYMSSNTLL